MREYINIMERFGSDYDYDPSDYADDDRPSAEENPNYLDNTVSAEELVLDVDMFNIESDLDDEDPTLNDLFDEADRLANSRIDKDAYNELDVYVGKLYDILEKLGNKRPIPLSKAAPALRKLYSMIDSKIADPEDFEWDEPEDPDPYRSRGLSRSDFM